MGFRLISEMIEIFAVFPALIHSKSIFLLNLGISESSKVLLRRRVGFEVELETEF